jgi:hypothetical protein
MAGPPGPPLGGRGRGARRKREPERDGFGRIGREGGRRAEDGEEERGKQFFHQSLRRRGVGDRIGPLMRSRRSRPYLSEKR